MQSVLYNWLKKRGLKPCKGSPAPYFYESFVPLLKFNLIMRMVTTAFALFVCMSAFGCMSGGSVIGSGKEARETREVDNFTQLELLGVGRVEVTIGNLRPLEISGDDNILPLIETKVTDGKLVIRTMRSIRPVQPLLIKATASDLTAIMLSGAGEIAVTGIANDNLHAEVAGAGEVTLSGQTSNLVLTLAGVGSVDARELVAKAVTVDMSGAGRTDVSPVVSLHVTITGAATVTYSGEPTITQKITGVGKLKRRNK
jgi:Putative auto-transporter adhesin, head GIN domain